MGGDESTDYKDFPKLVDLICDWAKNKQIEVIAWDDVLDNIELIPKNLIIHKWRGKRTSKRIFLPNLKVIMSHGYYFDRLSSPF